jgi:rhamnosyltransferase
MVSVRMHVTEVAYSQNPASANGAISIASVTVAYNGANVLERHLEALKRQSHDISEIIVVNNASSDGTTELLATKFPEITVLNLSENAGVGGGLAAGLEYAAVTKEYDWVWLFDQDSVPAHNALELLLVGLQHVNADTARVAILAPVCENAETRTTYSGLRWQNGRMVKSPPNSDEAVTQVDMVISSGSLMRREAIAAVGLPRTDFFMDFVDYEHCLRFRRHGFTIAVVRDSHLYHVIGEPTTFNVFGHTARWADHAPWRLYYMTRNEVFTIWEYYSSWRNKGFLLFRFARFAFFLLLFGKQKRTCLGMMYQGFLDGRAKRLGIRFHGASV